MKDGDYKFQLDVQKQYKDLLKQGKNIMGTDGALLTTGQQAIIKKVIRRK